MRGGCPRAFPTAFAYLTSAAGLWAQPPRVGRALAAPPGVAFPGLVKALRCRTDRGRWGTLGAGGKQVFPAWPGLANFVRFCSWRQRGRGWASAVST